MQPGEPAPEFSLPAVHREGRRHGIQFTAQFLIDRDGIVRWTNVECTRDGLAAFEKFPTQDELLTASQRIRNITDCVREGSS